MSSSPSGPPPPRARGRRTPPPFFLGEDPPAPPPRPAEPFPAEAQPFLEMMASQVAVALSAADATETSERRAHQDPLTGLPNRLQLTKDMDGDLAHLVEQGRPPAGGVA